MKTAAKILLSPAILVLRSALVVVFVGCCIVATVQSLRGDEC